MTGGGLNVISPQLKAIQSEVVEFNVGVSHLALDEERERYTRIREHIESFISALRKNKTAAGKFELENAQRLLKIAAANTETLRYLESISCLENIFADVTKAATVTAVGLSSRDGVSQRVLSSRFLTDNVKQCWDYTAQLSNLAAIHLKSAADFHIFNHEVNEVCACANQLKTISKNQLQAFSPDGRIGEASSLSSELEERLNAFQNMADRARKLASEAPSILPVQNRLLEVRNGVAKGAEFSGRLTVQLLIDYVGSNFSVRKGDSLPLVDTTENPYLWKVMTTSGPQYVPSIACVVASANDELMHDGYRTLATVKEAWAESLENYRRQLAAYYGKYLRDVGQRGVFQTPDLREKKRFLEDLDRLLVQPGADEGRLASIMEVLSGRTASRPEQASEVWSRSDLSLLRKPLTILDEHMEALRRVGENVDSYTARMREYLTAVNSEARGLQAQLESLRLTHDRNRTELNELYDRVHNWKTIYNGAIDAPPGEIGRLIISTASSSSGVFSDELGTIPLPPSPIGRITPTELATSQEEEGEEDTSITIYDRPQHKSSKIHGAVLRDKDQTRTEKSKVFTGGAILHPRQMQASLNVKQVDVQKSKIVRDVGTQTPYRRAIRDTQTELSGDLVNCRFAGTQSKLMRVDTMTQIGWFKAQKGQQVDGSVISATMEVVEPTPSVASATGGAVCEKARETYTTGPRKDNALHCGPGAVDMKRRDPIRQLSEPRTHRLTSLETDASAISSAKFDGQISTGRAGLEAVKKGRDIVTQINSSLMSSDFRNQQTMEDRTHNPVNRKSNGENRGKTGLMGAEASKNTFQCEVNAIGRICPEGGLQVSRPGLVEGTIDNACGGAKISAHCACMEKTQRGLWLPNKGSPDHRPCALLQPLSFHFTRPCYALCETPQRNRGTSSLHGKRTVSCQVGTKLVPRKVEVSAVSIQLDDKTAAKRFKLPMNSLLCPASVECYPELNEDGGIQIVDLKEVGVVSIQAEGKTFSAGVQTDKEKYALPNRHTTAREVCVLEFGTPDPKISHGSVHFCKRSSESGEGTLRILTSAECQFVVKGLQHPDTPSHVNKWSTPSMSSRVYTDVSNGVRTDVARNTTTCPTCRCQMETSTSSLKKALPGSVKSTQVGTVLTPTRVRLIGVGAKPTSAPKIRDFCSKVQDIVCPSTVELVSSLTEDHGITVKNICEVEAVNILAEDTSFCATVCNQDSGVAARQNSTLNQGKVIASKKGLLTTGTSATVKKPETIDVSNQSLLRQTKFEITAVKCGELCSLCQGTGRSAASTSTITQRPFVHEEFKGAKVASAECQVGTTLRPTRVHLANVQIQPGTAELARQVGVTPNAIIFPSNIELKTELAEQTGISVMGVQDVGSMELVAGTSVLETSFRSRAAGLGDESIPRNRKFMTDMSITCGKVGFTLGQAQMHKAKLDSKQSTETFTLQSVGCGFSIQDTSKGTVCKHCCGSGRVESSATGLNEHRSTAIDFSRKPSFIHKRTSTPISKSVECQVGIVLRPSCIEIGNWSVRPRNRMIAEHLGVEMDSILCPAKVNMIAEIREAPGVEVNNLKDSARTTVQAGNIVVDADVVARQPVKSSAFLVTQKKPHLVVNIKGSRSGLTIGENSVQEPARSTVTSGDSFTLSDIGCEVVLQNPTIRRVCVSCQGSGRMETTSKASATGVLETQSSDSSQQYSTLVPATMTTRPATLESKSCQVGTILTPTCVNVSDFRMYPKSTTAAVSSGTIVYPAAVEVESKLTENSGIHIKEVATMDSVNVRLGSKSYVGNSEQRLLPKAESCVLEVRSSHPEAVHGVLSNIRPAIGTLPSTGKFLLRNIGCEFSLREATAATSKYAQPPVSGFQSPKTTSHQFKGIVESHGRNASCQVGLALIPTTVQVADMSVSASTQRVATSLGLKADALICPSTVELEARLTEDVGVTVTDIREVKEVGIKVGDKKGMLNVTRHEMNVTPRAEEPPCLIFISHPPSDLRDTRSTNQAQKRVDQTCRCTFKIREGSESANAAAPLRPGLSQKGLTQENASCQVGLTMVPCKVNVSSTKLIAEEASAQAIGLSVPSTLQLTTCELEPRISERSGVAVGQIDAVEQLRLQIGSDTYDAAVLVDGSAVTRAEKPRSWGLGSQITSSIGSPRAKFPFHSSVHPPETGIANVAGPYLVRLREGATQRQSTLEVGSLTLGGRKLQLQVEADLRGKFTTQTAQIPHVNGDKFTGYGDALKRLRSPNESGDRVLVRRPNSRLCDVACEALIKPETMEKRLQTVFN